ncbi:MAG: sigma-54-dependent Fis family transcriptional regulator, partial [Candidatus Rokubacteria bacterium]|nr:sigma-54-dependent Fis family transcriptional regulator [Candidatus Rokubacteria bacterium]
MKHGAWDFLTKPIDSDHLLEVLRRAAEKQALAQRARTLEAGLSRLQAPGPLIAESPAMKRVLDLARQVMASDATVLLQGESGTGKECLARLIHAGSPRAGRPLITVNCAAIPEGLLESELFGYEKGAFTGALSRKPGRFELADGGTLFLDEVADLAPATQAKLLRVLQGGEIEPLGGSRTRTVDARILAATNPDLAGLVQERR